MNFKSNQQHLFQSIVTEKNIIYLCISWLLLEGCGCDRTSLLSQLLNAATHSALWHPALTAARSISSEMCFRTSNMQ